MILAEVPRWQPGFHDPTAMAWFLVVAYLGVAIACWMAGRRMGERRPVDRRLWSALGLFLLFLAINKQLDLHALGFDLVSDVARELGWYEQRWAVANWGMLGAGILAAVAGMAVVRVFRVGRERLRLAMIASFLLLLTLMGQSLSANPLGLWMQSGLFGAPLETWWRIEVSEVFEIGFLGVIGFAAANALMHAEAEPQPELLEESEPN